MPTYDVGYVYLSLPISEFRAQFLEFTREAIAKVDLMNSLGVEESVTNKCAQCSNDAEEDDFLCSNCRKEA